MSVSLFLFVFIANGFKYSVGTRQFRCDYTYNNHAGGWLKFHEIPASWSDARLRCHLEGSVLASPLTATLSDELAKAMRTYNAGCAIFTGIHATFSKGDFTSIEGVSLSKIPHIWAPNEPDNFKNAEQCIIMLPNKTIADENCSNVLPYLCFKKKSVLVLTDCGTTDSAYKLDVRTGKCYKFHSVPRTWSRAFMACTAEGGHLAIINSKTEANVIKELLERHPPESISGNFRKDIIFIGFHDWDEHGDWRTIHGETLSEAGYDVFSPGEPNNSTTGEFCGSVVRSGLLNDLWCEKPFTFICEKKPSDLVCADDDDE